MAKMRFKLFGTLALVAALAFTGCSSEDTVTEDEAMEEIAEVVSEVEAEMAAEAEGEAVTAAVELDYTSGLDENGHYEDVTAKDLVTLFDYKNIEVPEDVHTVSEDLVQEEVDAFLAYFVTSEQVMDRAIEDGDTVNIDYVGSVDGVEFEGGSTGGMGADVTIGVTSYIDDFLEQLIGHMPGESFDIEVTFPEAYGVEDLNGKDAVFAITVNYISQEVMPELSDDFVAENLAEANGWSTVAEMEAGIEEELKLSAVKSYIQSNMLGETAVSEIPDVVMTYQQTMMANYYQDMATMYGMTLEELLAAYAGFDSLDAMYEGYNDQLVEVANFTLVVQAIAEDAGIEVTEEAIGDYFMKYNGTGDYTEYEDMYGIEYLKYTILQEVVLDYLYENAELL